MTLESAMSRLDNELSRCDGPVDVRTFVHSFYPHDIEAGQHLERAFHARLLRGRLVSRLVKFDGHISAIIDRTCPVWH